MKKIIFLGLILFSANCFAQSDGQAKPEKIKGYKIKIILQDDTKTIRGYLYEVRGYLYEATDSSIVVIPSHSVDGTKATGPRLEIPIRQIKKIMGSVKNATLIGAIPGFTVGALLGGAIGVYAGSGGAVIGLGLLVGGIGGSITGGITAAFTSKTYSIKGNPEKYRTKYIVKLKEKSIVNRNKALD